MPMVSFEVMDSEIQQEPSLIQCTTMGDVRHALREFYTERDCFTSGLNVQASYGQVRIVFDGKKLTGHGIKPILLNSNSTRL